MRRAAGRYAAAIVLLLCAAWSGAAPCAELNVLVRDDRGQPVVDAVVLATPKAGAPAGRPTPEVVDQIDKEFVPYVKPILVGSAVSFPNRDNIRHHVYSFSPAKRFELPLYAGTPSAPIVFDKPGVVTLGCNIHDWMIAHIYVAETPYYGKTDREGKARIASLQPGEYVLRVWHPRLDGSEESTLQRLTLERTGTAEASWRIKLKPEFRARRAPAAGSRGYR